MNYFSIRACIRGLWVYIKAIKIGGIMNMYVLVNMKNGGWIKEFSLKPNGKIEDLNYVMNISDAKLFSYQEASTAKIELDYWGYEVRIAKVEIGAKREIPI
jgi:hypothetical protein